MVMSEKSEVEGDTDRPTGVLGREDVAFRQRERRTPANRDWPIWRMVRRR